MSNDESTLETGLAPEAAHALHLYEAAAPENRIRIVLLLVDLREMGAFASGRSEPCLVCQQIGACDEECPIRRATELLAALEHTVNPGGGT